MRARASEPSDRYELAPPLPPRPIQWRRAGGLLRELMRDPSETEKAFALFEAAGGSGDEPTVQAFAAHPEGRRMLVEKPALLPRLADRDGLAAHSEGSFARAYLAFARENGFAADGLLEAQESGIGRVNAQLDADRRWFFERAALIHDLWHVLTGYGTDAAGEVALLAFSTGQGLASRSIWLLLAAAALTTAPLRDGFAFQRFVVQAQRRGRGAAPLFVQRYEELLPRPLEDVRRELRIRPSREVHPEGLFRSTANTRAMVRVAA